MDDLYRAYRSCRKRKRNTVQEQQFSFCVSDSLNQLRNELITGTYKPSPLRTFLIDKPVLREIFAPEFRDRVCQHYIAERLEPLFEKELILDCYSCRKGKGTLFGIKRLKRFIAQCSANYTKDCYVLLGDIKGFFMSIVRADLWERVRRFVEEKYVGADKERVLQQLHIFLFSSPLENVTIRGNRNQWKALPDNKSVFACCGAPKPCDYYGTYTANMDVNEKGLTIGALPSQMLGNFYLSPFDHFCKHIFRFYGRYVDDFFVVHESKQYLLESVNILKNYLQSIGLTLHPDKIRILHYKQGIPFLGAIIKGKALLPGKRMRGAFSMLLREIDSLPYTIKFSTEIDRYECRINSYLGMLKHFNSRKYIRNMLERHPKIKTLFRIEENLSKANSFKRISYKRHLHLWKLTTRKFHQQFTRRNEQRRFLKRGELYNLIHCALYV